MNKKELNKGQRKFVTREKSRIRGQFFDLEKQAEEIGKIKGRFLKKGALKKPSAEVVKPVPVKSKPAESAKKAKASAKPRSESESALLQGKSKNKKSA